jgi:DNA-binding response OmpR family regulator
VSVLLVQHVEAEATVLGARLEEAGFRVTVDSDREGTVPCDVAAFDVIAIGTASGAEESARLSRRLRAEGYLGAIIAVSPDAADVPSLLDAGADDFVVAPIHASELVMRVRMALRRVVTRAHSHWGRIEIDRFNRRAYLRGTAVALTAREYELLACLLEAAGETMSRADLLTKVWGRDEDPGSNLVEVHLSRLRDKLGADASVIETVRRAGYRLKK